MIPLPVYLEKHKCESTTMLSQVGLTREDGIAMMFPFIEEVFIARHLMVELLVGHRIETG